jgi:hypothetical protein
MMTSGNGTPTVAITTSPITVAHNSTSNLQTTTQQAHIQSTPITSLSSSNNSLSNNNNTVSINNNSVKKKRFSVNIVNVKPNSAESSDDVETENITFAPSVTPLVKEETVQPWQTVTEAIPEIPAEYAVDQSCKCSKVSHELLS